MGVLINKLSSQKEITDEPFNRFWNYFHPKGPIWNGGKLVVALGI
jgi:hypothetical protein